MESYSVKKNVKIYVYTMSFLVFYLDNVVLTIYRETIYVNNKVCVLFTFA
jgi:hypothetical protein